MNKTYRRILPVAVVLILAAVAVGWYALGRSEAEADGVITASGTVEAVEVIISPELSGRVAEVLAEKGDVVAAGDPLFRLDDTLLQAQRDLAAAGQAAAQAGWHTAQAALATARTQYDQVLETARLAESPVRTSDWGDAPYEFEWPLWYFSKEEQFAAAVKEVENARMALAAEQDALNTLLDDPDYAGIAAAEQRLAQARAAFLTALDALNRAKVSYDQDLIDAAQDQYDSAETELEEAQQAYGDLLQTDQGGELLKARSRVRAAQARYASALEMLARLHTGEDSYPVKLAAAAVAQAEAAVNQAEKTAVQAQAQLDSIDVQIGKLTVLAPAGGTVIERNIEPGEMALAGSSAMIIGQLDRLTITVYIPEDRYGEIRLGQSVDITVDSFPGRTFTGTVTRIADRAEFTPRNVQTEEGRRTTVFAVDISVVDPGSELKPGMPADVAFE